MALQSRAAYSKRNLAMPISWPGVGLKQASLSERYESALRHLLITPRGSYYTDPDYGTTIYQLRTQGVNATSLATSLSQLKQAASLYIPDIQVANLNAEVDQDMQKLKISCVWWINGATSQMQGNTANRKETVVRI